MIKCKNGQAILDIEHLPPEIMEHSNESSAPGPGRPQKTDYEKVMEALELTAGNKAKAAKLLGISRTTLYRIAGKEKV
jgi:transcriptional regulator of acetoin/glycerol metabolism